MSTVEEEGYNAFWQNNDICPYRQDTDEHAEWSFGYAAAELDCDAFWAERDLEYEQNVGEPNYYWDKDQTAYEDDSF